MSTSQTDSHRPEPAQAGSPPGPRWPWSAFWLAVIAGHSLLLALLYLLPLQTVSQPLAISMVLGLAALIYAYYLPLRFVRRRALLAHITVQQSMIRKLLWNSALLKFTLAISSLALAVLMLVAVAALKPLDWLVIALGIPLAVLAFQFARRLLGPQFNSVYQFPYVIRVGNLLLVALLTILLVIVNLFWVEVPDTRSADIILLAQQAFANAQSQAAFPEAGWLLGASAVVDQLGWHLMQQLSGSVTADGWLKLLAWLAFLLLNAMKAGLIWTACSGLTMLARPLAIPIKGAALPPTLRSFAVMASVLLFGGWLSQQGVQESVVPVRLTALIDPCRWQAPQQQQQLIQASSQALGNHHQNLDAVMQQRIAAEVDAAFAAAQPGIEKFLDWNYSLGGQYTQLAYLGATTLGLPGLEHANLEELLDARIFEAIGQPLDQSTQLALVRVHETYDQQAGQLLASQTALLSQLAAQADCLSLPTTSFSLQAFADKSAVGAGALAGLATARLASRAGVRVISGAASRRVVSAASARAASSAATGSSGALCGPMVVICTPALAAGAWLLTDLALNSIDEAMNRDELRQQILMSLESQKKQLKAELTDHYAMASRQMIAAVDGYQQQRFRVLRDGL
ncbi:hypothetical protein QGM61_03305 [Pseudohongiella sp. SYSU M77423]|uniref:hypothetical protein n=1 Tax=Pseudohongiella sp. SYSU M77423 TaxID=3042312 RepID=UPI00247FE7A0|nr:hypothetical protein [Pseudohongiella sp. SYSU M77423]MDH7942838.1 hypothetical protein [Pseudohongiella sp. SYSU M77423]